MACGEAVIMPCRAVLWTLWKHRSDLHFDPLSKVVNTGASRTREVEAAVPGEKKAAPDSDEDGENALTR